MDSHAGSGLGPRERAPFPGGASARRHHICEDSVRRSKPSRRDRIRAEGIESEPKGSNPSRRDGVEARVSSRVPGVTFSGVNQPQPRCSHPRLDSLIEYIPTPIAK